MVADAGCVLGVDSYAPTKQQASLAKHWARQIFAGLVDDETLYDLSLCAVELVDNARKHGCPHGVISVAAYLTDDTVGFEVANDVQGITVPHVTDNLLTEEGHGLTIIAALATRWGRYLNRDQRQVVWCEFPKIDRTAGTLQNGQEGPSSLSTTNGASEPQRLMTPAEVAAAFRVDPKTVTRWAKAGKLTSIRTLGGHRRYREADIRALLVQERTCESVGLHQ